MPSRQSRGHTYTHSPPVRSPSRPGSGTYLRNTEKTENDRSGQRQGTPYDEIPMSPPRTRGRGREERSGKGIRPGRPGCERVRDLNPPERDSRPGGRSGTVARIRGRVLPHTDTTHPTRSSSMSDHISYVFPSRHTNSGLNRVPIPMTSDRHLQESSPLLLILPSSKVKTGRILGQ